MTRISARRGPSIAGRLVGRLVVPLLVRKRDGGPDALRKRIAQDRAAGPALPSAKLRIRYAFADTVLAGERVLRLGRRRGGARLRILYIHGGAYVFDLMPLQWTIAAKVIDRTGAELVLPLYPLAPEHDVAAGLACVERAYLALVAQAGADNVMVMGDSAGGGLALALAHRLRDAGHPPPRALLLLFPWLDATMSDPVQPSLERRDPILSLDQLRAAGRMWAGAGAPSDPAASPLLADQAGVPPALLLVGTHDLLLPDSRHFADRVPAAELVEYPGMFHGFIAAPIPEAHDALDRLAAFVARHRADARA